MTRQDFGFESAGAVLEVWLLEGFVGSVGNLYTIIRNDCTNAVSGAFSGLPERAIFKTSNGAAFDISYQGGDGNDVVLTQLSAPPVLNQPIQWEMRGFKSREPGRRELTTPSRPTPTSSWKPAGKPSATFKQLPMVPWDSRISRRISFPPGFTGCMHPSQFTADASRRA